jgi:hypothetical protein
MSETNNNELLPGHDHDGVDRRGFLKCMAWAGTGAFYVMRGGVLKSYSLSTMLPLGSTSTAELSFVQISDSHMGFNKQANPDVVGTLKAAIEKSGYKTRKDVEGVIQALEGMEMKNSLAHPQGDKLIRKEDHVGIIDCYISRVEGGKFEVKKKIPKEELAQNMPLRHDLSKMPA